MLGILFPVLSRAREASRLVQCTSNLRVFGQGMTAYAMQWNGILPWEGYAEGDRPIRHLGPWNEPSSWFNAGAKYGGETAYCDLLAGGASLPKSGDKSTFVCPSADEPFSYNGQDQIVDGYYLLWGLDANGTPQQQKTFWCYGYNTQLDNGTEDRNVNYRVVIRLGRIPDAANTVFLVEKRMTALEVSNADDQMQSLGQQEVSYNEFTARHHGGGNILMCDGHVSWFSYNIISGTGGRRSGLKWSSSNSN